LRCDEIASIIEKLGGTKSVSLMVFRSQRTVQRWIKGENHVDPLILKTMLKKVAKIESKNGES